ncbi:MAG TPA: CHAP domain-containing protein [Rhizomicrobium sp.]|jgi:hypothetical protein|nr:CHAP domain-containing protein [Rhizomicrobium sp.]
MISGSFIRIASVAGLCALLGGCGGLGTELSSADLAYGQSGAANARGTTPAYPADNPNLFPDDNADTAPSTVEGTALQCVPYARDHSGINIHGDAYTWWDKAAGVYYRGATPILASVMVLNGYAGKHRAHVAVVRRLVSPREIRIDHANWLDDGAVYVNDPVIDVSADNDWSQVKVWNIRSGSWGTKVYRVQGFIGPGPAGSSPLVASNAVPDRAAAPDREDPIARQIAASDAAADDSATPGDDR